MVEQVYKLIPFSSSVCQSTICLLLFAHHSKFSYGPSRILFIGLSFPNTIPIHWHGSHADCLVLIHLIINELRTH